MNRVSYFENVNSIVSPLLLLPTELNILINTRTNDLSEPIDAYLNFADDLFQLNNERAKTRAAFIRMQCGRIDTEDFFEQHRESWGIPKFEEALVTVDDFKNGFLFKFRDHSTSWSEDFEARTWFFNSIESKFVRHYQFWACDNGIEEEVLMSTSGEYKNIMWTIVKDYQIYSALASTIFTKKDLVAFYRSFDEEKEGYYKEDLLQLIKENPNW